MESGIGPSRATAGPGKPLSRGPITTSFRMYRDGDAELPKASRGRKREQRYPLTIRLEVWGNVVSCPSGGRGQAPAKMDFMHI